jgi:uncharacterized protein YcfJ
MLNRAMFAGIALGAFMILGGASTARADDWRSCEEKSSTSNTSWTGPLHGTAIRAGRRIMSAASWTGCTPSAVIAGIATAIITTITADIVGFANRK